MNLERQKEKFKNHIATFTDYGNIKILDFKAPDSGEYRIRFLFEEDYCKLHISGDLGELIASNYSNMTYEKFSDFVNNTGYFAEKIDCMSRDIKYYDDVKAREDILKLIKDYDIEEEITSDKYDFETNEDKIEEFIDNILLGFDSNTGISNSGQDILEKYIDDSYEAYCISRDIGIKETGILELYMLAFKLANKQLRKCEKNA